MTGTGARVVRLLRRSLPLTPAARAVSPRWYLAQNPDVASAPRPRATRHYLDHGWQEGRRPNRWFDPAAYLAAYPDVAEQGVEPLEHYLRHGRAEGRTAGVSPRTPLAASLKALAARGGARGVRLAARVVPAVEGAAGLGPDARSERDLLAEEFDEQYYAAANPEVAASGQDLLGHFLTQGWRESRNPSRAFDVGHYLEDNPDVADAGINPLKHYVLAGRDEGRVLRPPLSAAQRRLDQAVPPRLRAKAWAPVADVGSPLSASALRDRLGVLAAAASLVLSVSHDDYAASTGGVQQMLVGEQRALQDARVPYLHLSPARPLPMLADLVSAEAFAVVLRLDGERLGVALLSDVQDALARLSAGGLRVDVVVHQLMGHAPELVQALLDAVGAPRPLVFAHDYFSLCENYALLRNDLEFCGAPPVASTTCTVCVYGGERQRHLDRVQAFHDATDPDVLVPSAFAGEVWSRAGLRHRELRVQPLARLVEPPDARPLTATGTGPLRVAHLGTRSYLKGWHVFEELALRHQGDDAYDFLQLGLDDGSLLPENVTHVDVRVSPAAPDAMVEALTEHRIDVVLIWSLAAETFSFTTHEALAAGAFVVARAGAGNVWPAVAGSAAGQGLALEDQEQVFALFSTPALRTAVREARRVRRLLVSENGAADELLRRRLLLPVRDVGLPGGAEEVAARG